MSGRHTFFAEIVPRIRTDPTQKIGAAHYVELIRLLFCLLTKESNPSEEMHLLTKNDCLKGLARKVRFSQRKRCYLVSLAVAALVVYFVYKNITSSFHCYDSGVEWKINKFVSFSFFCFWLCDHFFFSFLSLGKLCVRF